MKITLGQVFIAVMLTSLSYANAGKAQAILNKQVTITINNTSLNSALKKLEKSADVKFVYSKSIIKTDKEVSITANKMSLNTILDKLLTANGIAYEVLNDRIVLNTIKTASAVSADGPGNAVNQAFPVSGKVVDENGQPLPGVSVRLNNTDRGTNTDANGEFTLNVDADTDVLTFSFIGYDNQTVTVGSTRTFNVQMAVGKGQNLQEVVVQGYGTITRANVSTSVSSVKGEALRERPNSTNIVQALQGRAPGVNVMINSGKPGGAPAVKIRGVGSINTTSDPLWVVDGFIGANPINIDPNIVESMEILKDAAATAIYGARGSNGVIIVTTRRGKAGTSEISISNNVGFSSILRKPDLMNANERLQLFVDQYNYNPANPAAPHLPIAQGGRDFPRKADLFNADGSPKYNTDWVDESTRLGVSNNHSLAFTGGTEKMSITANLNYRNLQGLLLNSYEKRVSGFVNVMWKVKPWLDIQAQINTGAAQGNNVDLDPLSSTAIRKMYEMLPFLPVTYPDGKPSLQGDYPGAENSENPVTLLNGIKNTVGTSFSNANFTGIFHITKDLDLTTTLGGLTEGNYDFYYAGRTLTGVSATDLGRARRRHTNIGQWSNSNFLTYKHDFGKHNVVLTAGADWIYRRSTYTLTQATNFFDDYYSFNNIGAGSVRGAAESDWLQEQTNAFYGRLVYNYDSRYLFQASYRVDGASQVASGKKYGSFPSIALGWNIHNEAFFKESSLARTVSQLKLRGSWGKTGNALLTPFSSLPLITTGTYVFGGSPVTIATPLSLGNPNLGWEEAVMSNVALDLGFANNRVSFTIEYYNKENRNLLLNKELSMETGYPNAFENIGAIRNRGIEIGLNTVNIENKNFRWSTTANFTMNRSKVLKLIGVPIFGTWGGWIAEGRPLNEFYGFVRQGVWGTNEKEEAAKYGRKPGDTKWLDANNNGAKDIDDRRPLGNAMPRWEATLINRFSYKGFSLLIDLGGMYGLNLINTGKHLMQNSAVTVNSFRDIQSAWKANTNENTMVPAVRTPQDSGNPSEVADSYAVEDGSFLRVRNIGLSYTSTSPWLKNILVKSLTIGANVENAFLWTRYSGFDPEYTSLTPQLDQGVDIYQYPKPRIVSFSLNASF
ncbi:SusC/RagA family TonB-linked outer membrane protein [Mucilaginibacter hurinus]|nr:SusC/RagA family TonB-linked outer membrane protein [Mucilaginibacter hurinus]